MNYGPRHKPVLFFFFNDTATTEIYTLSLHDALPISGGSGVAQAARQLAVAQRRPVRDGAQGIPHAPLKRRAGRDALRSEEHTSELQSRLHLVCRLLLEKKKIETATITCIAPADYLR